MPVPTENVGFEVPSQMAEGNPHRSEVLQSLLDRNQGWASHFAEKSPERLTATSKGQAPKVCWIGCSDSRVPEGSVCQTYPGEIFTIRNVANQWRQEDDSTDAALTFAIEALGVEDIIVVGHTSCGGINAAAAGAASGPPAETAPSSLGRYLIPLTKLAYSLRSALPNGGADVDAAAFQKKLTTENVKKQLENLKQSEVIQRNWTSGKSTLVEGKVCKKVTLHG